MPAAAHSISDMLCFNYKQLKWSKSKPVQIANGSLLDLKVCIHFTIFKGSVIYRDHNSCPQVFGSYKNPNVLTVLLFLHFLDPWIAHLLEDMNSNGLKSHDQSFCLYNFQTDRSGQTVQIQVRLLLELSSKSSCSNFRGITANFSGVRLHSFKILR